MSRPRACAAVATASVCVLVLAACGSSSTAPGAGKSATRQPPPNVAMPSTLGPAEGLVNVVAWAGYAEDGTNDPKVDWVHPFEKATGCKVNVKVANTSDEMVTLMHTGQYDVVSASGDATLRLIYSGDVAPVNTALVPNYSSVFPFLKDRDWNSVEVDGKRQAYGIPHGWGANLLMWNTKVVNPAPTSWGAVFEASSPYRGKLTAYDSPIYIADAALYLMKSKPELGIKNPYSLDQKQFDAAVALLKTQRQNIGEYWADYTKQVQAFESGTSVLGTTWQVITNLIQADKKVSVKAIVPSEGSTGWSDTWMVSARTQAPHVLLQVDGLDRLAVGERRGGPVVRRGTGPVQGLRRAGDEGALRHLPRGGQGLLRQHLVLDDADQGLPGRAGEPVRRLLEVDAGLDRDQGLGR